MVRTKVYASRYWKEHCMGLTAETLIDEGIKLKYIGGTYGGNLKPTKFLILVLKML
jgi:pre-mRNA-splicing factor 38A